MFCVMFISVYLSLYTVSTSTFLGSIFALGLTNYISRVIATSSTEKKINFGKKLQIIWFGITIFLILLYQLNSLIGEIFYKTIIYFSLGLMMLIHLQFQSYFNAIGDFKKNAYAKGLLFGIIGILTILRYGFNYISFFDIYSILLVSFFVSILLIQYFLLTYLVIL